MLLPVILQLLRRRLRRPDTDQCNADLDGGQENIWILGQLESQSR